MALTVVLVVAFSLAITIVQEFFIAVKDCRDGDANGGAGGSSGTGTAGGGGGGVGGAGGTC
jgi:hypothetical protein